MSPKGLLCLYLGMFHFASLVFQAAELYYLYKNNMINFFIANTTIYGLFYLLEMVCSANKIFNAILALFGLQWFRYPFSIKPRKNYSNLTIANTLELILQLYIGFINAYWFTNTNDLPLSITICLYIFSVFEIPLLYNGTIFSRTQSIPVSVFLVTLIEVALNYLFVATMLTLDQFYWIFVAGCWRILFLFEPYAFWSSISSVVSPFRAMHASGGARSLTVIYLLHIEPLLIIYFTAWYMERNIIHSIFVYVFAAYYVIYFFLELFATGFPFEHKIGSINSAGLSLQGREGPVII